MLNETVNQNEDLVNVLAEFISSSQKLEELYLCDTGLSNESVITLLSAFSQSKSLDNFEKLPDLDALHYTLTDVVE